MTETTTSVTIDCAACRARTVIPLDGAGSHKVLTQASYRPCGELLWRGLEHGAAARRDLILAVQRARTVGEPMRSVSFQLHPRD